MQESDGVEGDCRKGRHGGEQECKDVGALSITGIAFVFLMADKVKKDEFNGHVLQTIYEVANGRLHVRL